MSKKDFDTLFTILDVDGNGGIDFVEFCQYMGEIGLDMETIEKEIDQVQYHVSQKQMSCNACEFSSHRQTLERAK